MAASFISFPEFIAQEVIANLYAKSVLINLVSKDWSDLFASKGEKVTILTPDAATIEEGDATFASADANPGNVAVLLDKFKRTKPIKVSDKIASMSAVDISAIYAVPIAEALVGQIESDLMTEAMTLTNTVGVDNTAPTGFAPLGSNIKQEFDTLLIPEGGRNVVLGPTAENAFHQTFALATVGGDTGVAQQTTGGLGYKFGLNYFGSTRATRTHSSSVVGVAGVAFAQNAISLVTRPLVVPAQAVPGTISVVQYKGIGLRVTSWYEPKDTASYLKADVLYGVKKLTERGFLILGDK